MERESNSDTTRNKYCHGNFIATIRCIDNALVTACRSTRPSSGFIQNSLPSRQSRFNGNSTPSNNLFRSASSRPTRRTSGLDFDYVHGVTADLSDLEKSMDYSNSGDLTLYCTHGLDLNEANTSSEDTRLFAECVNAVALDVQRQNSPFDTSRPCAVCGAIGHSFDNCPALQDAGEIKKNIH